MISRSKLVIGGLKKVLSFKQVQRHSSQSKSSIERIETHPIFSSPSYIGTLPNKQDTTREPIQQDDECKKFYMTIVNEDLKSAYKKHDPSLFAEKNGLEEKVTGKSVLIVYQGFRQLLNWKKFDTIPRYLSYNTGLVEEHKLFAVDSLMVYMLKFKTVKTKM